MTTRWSTRKPQRPMQVATLVLGSLLVCQQSIRLGQAEVRSTDVDASTTYRFEILDVPGATGTSSASINASGQVTGSYADSQGIGHGFVYTGGTYATLDVPGATVTYLASINDSGQVTGSYADSQSLGHGFIAYPAVAPKPIPTLSQWGLLLLVSLLPGIAWRCRRYVGHG